MPTKQQYRKDNPLGGPAKMFDAIAERLRAGEDFDAVMKDYEIIFVKRFQGKTAMSKITKAAEGRPCTIRLPGCNGDPTSSVWAHINSIRWGAGRGHKSPDICGVIACHNCHAILDGRIKTDLDRDFIMLAALQGHMESLNILWKEGII